MKEFVMVLLGLAGLIVLFCVVYFAIRWVLGPLDRAAKNRRFSVQFSLADFLCLFVEVQLALGGLALLLRSQDQLLVNGAIVACVVIVAAVVLIWWTGVRTLSRAGIHGTFARAVTLTIGIPFGFAASVAIPITVLMTLASFERMNHLPPPQNLLLLVMTEILIVVGLGFMTRHFLANAEPLPESTPLQDLVRFQQISDPAFPPHSETRTSP
jgi:hypothetical protein